MEELMIWKVILYASLSVIGSVMLYNVVTLGLPARCDDECIAAMKQEAKYRMNHPDYYGR
jgi:hypothetical protein